MTLNALIYLFIHKQIILRCNKKFNIILICINSSNFKLSNINIPSYCSAA